MLVNGQEIDLAANGSRTLTELIGYFQLDPDTVAIEMNGTIPGRESWSAVTLSDADRIELIRFVGGG